MKIGGFMNTELFQSKFKEVSGELQKKFSSLNLTDEEIQRAKGSADELATLVSSKLGISKEEAMKKIEAITSHLDDKSFMDKVGEKFEEIKDKFTHH
jgi:uncharacterized protein YjbJ (UPF0337 family)